MPTNRIVRLIGNKLADTYKDHIDFSDLKSDISENEKENAVLTRSLAAFPLTVLAGISEQQAGFAITDGYDDYGIDAIFVDSQKKILYIIQSKWQHDGNGSLSEEAALKLQRGIDKLFQSAFSGMNDRIIQKRKEIEYLLKQVDAKVVIVAAYSGKQALSSSVRDILDNVTRKINEDDMYEIASLEVFDQQRIYSAIISGEAGEPITVNLSLNQWGKTHEPLVSLYGYVSASDIVLWKSDIPKIFSKNIRYAFSNSDVNDGIVETLEKNPEKFWYYNNGITALCDSHQKVTATNRNIGIFKFKGFQVVNGAQTVSSIIRASESIPEEKLSQAYVQIRIIAIENSYGSLADDITRYNNTQNRIDSRDFVSLDTEQERIQAELKLRDVKYAYKSGDTSDWSGQYFTLEDATIALACSLPEVHNAVRVKDKISYFWKDITKAPYKTIFNRSTDSELLWKRVQVLRLVDSILSEKSRRRDDYQNREHLIATHGNRILLHLIYRDMSKKIEDSSLTISEDLKTQIINDLNVKFERLVTSVAALYESSYPSNIFRNAEKCREIISPLADCNTIDVGCIHSVEQDVLDIIDEP